MNKRISWLQLASLAAACLSAGTASAQGANPVDFNDLTPRVVLIQTEDTACDNFNPPTGTSAADPSCKIFANDNDAVFFDTTNDFYGILENVGTDEWKLTIPIPIWTAAAAAVVGGSGATVNAVSANVMRIHTGMSGPASVAPFNPPNYWTGTASYLTLPLALTGTGRTPDLRYFGDTTPLGQTVPLGFSCAGHEALPFFDPGMGPLVQSLFGPAFPGPPICDSAAVPPAAGAYIDQPGYDAAKSSVTAFASVSIIITDAGVPGTPPVFTPLDFRLQEFPPGTPDADGDTVPDEYDNCVNVPNLAQCDGDLDGYGNQCDADLNNDGNTSAADVGPFLAALSASPPAAAADINCDGNPSASDVGPFLTLLTGAASPGPSGFACAGTVPCPTL